MKVFYSIMYISIKPIVKEQLSIGLFLSDGETAFFHYSVEKLNLTRKLISEGSFNMIKEYIEGFDHDINGKTKSFKQITIDYFDYLSDYNNNLISFSKPTLINISFNQEIFEKLFEKFIFKYKNEPVENPIKNSLLSVVKKSLYPRIKTHVNIDKTLTPKEIPTLLIPKIKVNFIGRNDKPVAGEVIDFELGVNSISHNISHFMTLINALEKEKGKYYIIGKEPSKNLFPEQHSTWKQISNSSTLEFVALDEVDKVSEYMNRHHVKPFLIED